MMPSSSMPLTYNPFTTLQAAGHDRAALARLVEEEQPGLTAWLERVLRDNDLAQEAVQETWLVLSRGDWSFAARTDDAAGDVRAWLRQIALRAALRLRERQHTQRRHRDGWFRSRAVPVAAPTPLEQLAEQDRRELVWAMVAELPASLRQSLELRFRDGLDFTAIGRAQGCSALAARVRTWRGLAHMRRRLLVLGILVMPTSLMATLGGAAGGMASGAMLVGVLPRALALVAESTVQARVGSVALAGGMAAATLCWWLFTSGEVGADTTQPAPVHALQAVTPTAEQPPWELRRPLANSWFSPGEFKPEPFIPPDTTRAQVHIEMLRFLPDAHALPFATTRPTVLTAEQREQVFAHLTAQDGAILDHPKLLTQSGHRATAVVINSTGYVAGYQKSAIGPEPVIGTLDFGYLMNVTPLVEADGIRMVEADIQNADQRGCPQRSARVQSATGEFQEIGWSEPLVQFSQAMALPPNGILIPPGGALLLPANEGHLKRATPGGITSTPDAAFRPWMLLIVPSVEAVEPEPQPEQPKTDGEPALPSTRT